MLGFKLIRTSTLKGVQEIKWQSELQCLWYYLNYKAKQKLRKGMAFRMGALQAFRWLFLAAVWSNCLHVSSKRSQEGTVLCVQLEFAGVRYLQLYLNYGTWERFLGAGSTCMA